MINFQYIFKKFIEDTRLISYDEIFMKDIESLYKDSLKSNLTNIYRNSPSFYSRITSSDKIFESYCLWFLAIYIISSLNYNMISKYNISSELTEWINSRKDSNLSYFIIGPLNNQTIDIDFISHYNSIMNSQNTTTDISTYQQISNLQCISSNLDEFKDLFISSPNAYNKLSNSVNAYSINIDSKDINLKIINNMTTMDCSNLDIGDISDSNIKAKYDTLYTEESLKIQNSKIPIKKLETILNDYDRFNLIRFEIDSKVFDLKLDSINNCFIIFDGLHINSRNIYSDSSNESFRILGSFSYDSIKDVYSFTPTNEYITYHKGESIVRKFNIYAYLPNVGNINKTFELELTYEDFNNVFIMSSSSNTSSDASLNTSSAESKNVNLNTALNASLNSLQTESRSTALNTSSNNFFTAESRNIHSNTFRMFSKKNNRRINKIHNFEIIHKEKHSNDSKNLLKNNARIIRREAIRNISIDYDLIKLTNYNIIRHNQYYYLIDTDYSPNDNFENCTLFVDEIGYAYYFDGTYEGLTTDYRLSIINYFSDFLRAEINHEYYKIRVFNTLRDEYTIISRCSIIVDNIEIYFEEDDFHITYDNIKYNSLEVLINYNMIFVNDSLITDSYNANYKIRLKIIKISDDEIDILENNEVAFKIVLSFRISEKGNKIGCLTITEKSHSTHQSDDKIYYFDGNIFIGEWMYKIGGDTYYPYIPSFKILSSNIHSYEDVMTSLLHIDLSDLYETYANVEFKDINMSTYEECSGLLLDDSFIECSKYIIRGNMLYIVYENDDIKISNKYNVTNKKFSIFPTIKYEHIIYSELSPYEYYKQNEYGNYDLTDEVTNVAALKLLFDKENIKIILATFNDEYILLVQDLNEGGIYLIPTYILDECYLYGIVYKKTISGLDIFYTSSYKTKVFYISKDKYMEYASPIPSMNASLFFKYINKKVNNYMKFELKTEYIYTGYDTYNFNEVSKNIYDMNYNNYPIIITDNNLITNKKYILKIDNSEYNGFILKCDSNKYIFCTNNEINIYKNSKIILKINDTLYTCSFYLD